MEIKRKTKYCILALIMCMALFSRLWQFGAIPGDINQDEAFAGYEAWAIMTHGVDSSLHPYPVYLTAWGSGMNALESYLMMPFIALFGLKVWVIRLPQLLTGLASIAVAYLFGRRAGGERFGLVFAFLLAISPWHILLCRWGLESNLVPGFVLFGLYFFARGLEDGRFLPLSALFYGLSLYCYATIWAVLPFIILMGMIYGFISHRLHLDRWLLISFLILALLALPLLLFMCVNYGLMDEIVLKWISVPKMLLMRSGEISLKNIPYKLRVFRDILLHRSDGLPWNSPGKFGIYYVISLPLALLGLAAALKRVFTRKAGAGVWLMLFQLIGGLALCILVSVNVNRMNILLTPLVFLAAYGLETVFSIGGRRIGGILCAGYVLMFACFEAYYFTDYAQRVAVDFSFGLEEALGRALDMDGTIYLSADVHYPKVLFYTRTPPEEFNESVEYRVYPAYYLEAKSFGRFRFGADMAEPDRDGVYVLRRGYVPPILEEAGFTAELYGDYYLLYYE